MEKQEIPELEIHPLAEIFPALSEDEVTKLAKCIADVGQEEDNTTFQGKILDRCGSVQGLP